MSNIPYEDILKQVDDLFNKAKEEEIKYNWNNEIKILKAIEGISLDNKLKDIEGEVYFKLGEIYQIAAEFEKTEENILNYYQLSISYFKKACNVFKDLKTEEKINASLGFINFLKYISGSEEDTGDILIKSAKNYFEKVKIIYQKKGNQIESLKMAILESRALDLFIGEKSVRLNEQIDFMELSSEHENLITNIWEELKNQHDFPEIYLYHFISSIIEFCQWTLTYLPVSTSIKKQYIFENLNLMKEIIQFFEKTTKIFNLYNAYLTYSLINMLIAAFFVDNQFEQKKYFKIAQNWLNKGKNFDDKIIANPPLILFSFIQFTAAIFLINLGFFAKNFKYIMESLNLLTDSISLYFPKIMATQLIFITADIFLFAGLSRSIPDIQRIDFAKKSLDLIELSTNTISIIDNPNYKTYDLTRNIMLCIIQAILGDLVKDKKESSRHLQNATKMFKDISNYNFQKLNNTHFYFYYLNLFSRTGIILANNSLKKSEKINYYQKAIDLLLKSKERIISLFHIENLFFIGDTYYEVGKLTDNENIFKKSYLSYMDTIKYCKNKGYSNSVGSAFINLAKIEDRLGNFLFAAENYKNAIDSFDRAIMTLTYTKLGKKIEKLKNYIEAWNIIEIAKSYHVKESHQNAELKYKEASQILGNIREYKFEAPFYSAWAILENAENLSKQNKHQEASEIYIISKNKFQYAAEILNSYLDKRKSPEDIDRISKLIQVAKVRERYCIARHQIETARLESKKGRHLVAAELYNKAGSIFENLCLTFGIKREKDELMAIYYLCKAWENMERADIEQKSSLYALASELFEKASKTFPESRMKKLSLGNSLYCSALECGSLFDKSSDLEEKTEYYRKIKIFLRESSKNYQLGGFEQDSQWALATSTFFDGIWHLIQSDYEVDHTKKDQYLNIAINYFNSALVIFGKAGHKQRRDEILKYIKMIKDEKAILTSALNL
ncbi:MAG: hypothetical protein ACFFDN_22410, partial [Candidatus Hodarchaeota archaeon]